MVALVKALVLAVLVTSSAASVIQRRADPPRKLPKRATDNDLRYQPALDFDTDSCYNVPAIGCDEKIAEGLEANDLTTGCRDKADLENANVYSRQRCNSGYCLYMYDYYFEKDYAQVGGHKHDWEHIIVWVPDDSSKPKYVCASQHGEWLCNPQNEVLWDGDHPKMVYHKDMFLTHCFRFANGDDDNKQENELETWQYGDLVGWFGFPTTEIRTKLEQHNFESASFALAGSFANNIRNAMKEWCDSKYPPGSADHYVCTQEHFPHPFDPERDENGSPGQPGGGNGCSPSNPNPNPPSTSIKAMIIGDSITQGFEGDYTWRYRLWEWLRSQNVSPDFVGPWSGTHTNAEPSDPKPPRLIGSGPAPPDAPRTSGAYANGVDFDSAHWALWGRQAAQVKGEIQGQVSTHSPDWLLIMLGFNDLGWFVSGPEGLLSSVKEIVDKARAARSNVRLLIANVVHRSFIEGREDLVTNTNRYNDMLKAAIPGWSTSQSEIRLVDVNSIYSCGITGACPAAYDGLHPGPQGEYEIASAFSKALVDMGVGRSSLSVPSNPPAMKTPTTPNNLRVLQAPWGLSINWDKVWGANAYEVRSRLKGQSQWSYWPSGIAWPVNRWDNSWVLDGQEREYSVRTNMGIGRTSDWATTASNVAKPTNPKGPNNVYVEPQGNSIFIRWDSVPGATLYEVITFDSDADGVTFPNGRGVLGTSVTVSDSLTPGNKYAIAIVTWVSSGPGWPTVAMSVRIGSGRPGAVERLGVTNSDPTTVTLSWPHVAGAASYRVWFRNFKNNEAFRTDEYSIASDNSHVVAFLFPGTWNFEFYVVAMNGNLEGGRSNTVIPPVYPGFEGK